MSKKPSHNKPLKEVIDQFLEMNGMDKKFEEIDIQNIYKELMGKMITSKTESLWFKNGVLYIKLSSSVLRQELSMNKGKIAELINQKLGKEVIKEVSIK